jgi:uncharacterized protein
MTIDASDDHISNPTANPRLPGLDDAQLSRRSVLKGSLGLGALGFIASSWLSGCKDDDDDAAPAAPAERMLGFAAVATNSLDAVTLPAGYVHQVLIPWGAPINAVAPAWVNDASQGWQEQEQQIGDNHDGMAFFGLNSAGTGPGTRSDEGLLVLNHEYINPEYFYVPGSDANDWLLPFTYDKARKALAGTACRWCTCAAPPTDRGATSPPRRTTAASPATRRCRSRAPRPGTRCCAPPPIPAAPRCWAR